MLAGAGVDRQHEREPSWAPRPVGRGGGCDRELHADADRLVYACQLAVEVGSRRSVPPNFGIESESATLACQSAPVVDAARMVKEQRQFGVPHQLHYFRG